MDDLRTKIIVEAHGSRYSIHTGFTKMYHDLKQNYCWDGMKKDIAYYDAKCPNCQKHKVEDLKLGDVTQTIDFPTCKWEAINMDFVVDIPRTRRQHDSIWVIVDRMAKFSHFIPLKSTYRAEYYVKLYIDEIVRWHGILLSIISDRGAQFTSHFLRSF